MNASGYVPGREMPVATVVVVAWRAASALAQALDRFRQVPSAAPFELVVVDGGSDDGTVALLETAGDVVSRWISEPDHGIYDAMNKGIALARGRYILLLGVDDLVVPDAFVGALTTLRDADADICAWAAQMLDNGRPRYVRRPRRLDASLLFRTMPFSHNAMFAKRELYGRVGNYRTDLRIISDLDFLVRAQSQGASFSGHAEILIESELTGVSGVRTDLLEAENAALLAARYPVLSDDESVEMYRFRRRLAGADDDVDLATFAACCSRSAQVGALLHLDLKKALNEGLLRFVDAGIDLLLRCTPRNHLARALPPEPLAGIKGPLPLLTVGMTTYNCDDTVEAALSSVLAQDWPNLEVIIVDDGSTDGTMDVLRRLMDGRCRLVQNQENLGVAYGRSLIAQLARGSYVMYSDDDDVSLPHRLRTCHALIQETAAKVGTADVVCFSTRLRRMPDGSEETIFGAGAEAPVDMDRAVSLVAAHLMRVAGVSGSFDGHDLAVPVSMGTGVGMYPTRLLRSVGFQEAFRRAEDLEFVMACAALNRPIHFVSTREPVYLQRVTSSNDKSKDVVFGFYALLALVHRRRFEDKAIDVQRLVRQLTRLVKGTPLRSGLQRALAFSDEWRGRGVTLPR